MTWKGLNCIECSLAGTVNTTMQPIAWWRLTTGVYTGPWQITTDHDRRTGFLFYRSVELSSSTVPFAFLLTGGSGKYHFIISRSRKIPCFKHSVLLSNSEITIRGFHGQAMATVIFVNLQAQWKHTLGHRSQYISRMNIRAGIFNIAVYRMSRASVSEYCSTDDLWTPLTDGTGWMVF